jgi:RNA polymerase sigma factor (sigma-70 family)
MGTPLRAVPSEPQAVGTTVVVFDDFFRDSYEALYRALCLVTGNGHEAEDVMQVAYMRIFERWDRVRAMENPEGFLYRVAMNEFRSGYRRTKRAVRRAVTSTEPDVAFERAVEDRDVVVRALSGLTPQQRAAVVLTMMLGYSSEEAGELLGVKAAAVRQLGSRARASLREAMGEEVR